MSAPALDRRFFDSTRGQIVARLRRRSQTVEELAAAVQLTDNAVRAHLATLERDGIVRHVGVRRGDGAGKPAALYEIAVEAEPMFSRAYAPLLTALVEELAAQLPASRRDRLLRAAGRRVAAGLPRPASSKLVDRVHAAVALLNSLGADAEVER